MYLCMKRKPIYSVSFRNMWCGSLCIHTNTWVFSYWQLKYTVADLEIFQNHIYDAKLLTFTFVQTHPCCEPVTTLDIASRCSQITERKSNLGSTAEECRKWGTCNSLVSYLQIAMNHGNCSKQMGLKCSQHLIKLVPSRVVTGLLNFFFLPM